MLLSSLIRRHLLTLSSLSPAFFFRRQIYAEHAEAFARILGSSSSVETTDLDFYNTDWIGTTKGIFSCTTLKEKIFISILFL